MKKYIFILAALLFGLYSFGQDRTVSFSIENGGTYMNYTGSAADTLTANQDTIDFVVKYWGQGYVKKVSVKTRYDLVSGNDTTVSVSVYGKEFDDDATYVQIIAAATSSDVNANNTVQILTSDWTETVAGATDTFNPDSTTTVAARTLTPLDKSYRYYRVRYIYSGASAVGSGVLIDDFELKLYTD